MRLLLCLFRLRVLRLGLRLCFGELLLRVGHRLVGLFGLLLLFERALLCVRGALELRLCLGLRTRGVALRFA